ncbi:hypothetical protein C8R48DRAFT_377191 [Suillus tomentosus]|nr:hypothetical protein C8R48DRAFT_377191 [Suillus tomentosus]
MIQKIHCLRCGHCAPSNKCQFVHTQACMKKVRFIVAIFGGIQNSKPSPAKVLWLLTMRFRIAYHCTNIIVNSMAMLIGYDCYIEHIAGLKSHEMALSEGQRVRRPTAGGLSNGQRLRRASSQTRT